MKKCFVMVLLCCLLVAGTAFAKTGTLLVAFGTSMDSARPAIDDIEKAYKKAAGNEPVLLAFTSDIIRNKLAKEGKPVLSVNAAMNELAAQGVTDLKIQSLHIAPAEEYNQLERMVVKNITKNPGVFKTVKVGYPLLVSEKDLDAVVKVVLASLPKDRKPGDAVVLMGHGNDRGPGDLTLAATAAAFHIGEHVCSAGDHRHEHGGHRQRIRRAGPLHRCVFHQRYAEKAGNGYPPAGDRGGHHQKRADLT